jgi:hypothetical protein
MDFKKINNITGWVIFALAILTYFLTMSPTASFWDCGEFIACANELEVPHPPGAPFFLLIGRIFAMLSFGNVENVAFMMNVMSVLCSAFTVLFTFWIITDFARRMLKKEEVALEMGQKVAIMFAGATGALACTFADSFWFNAVEAEVYALSSLFTAAVVWLMMKWEARADEPGNLRWLVLIAYLMGLSIGVHLLNLLTIPALAFLYYFRKYNFSWQGFLATGAISVLILLVIQAVIIVYTFDIAWGFEKFFTGTLTPSGVPKGGLGLPFGTGLILFMILLTGGIAFGIWYSQKKQKPLLNMILMCVTVIYVGLGSYAMIPIRSQANPPIDENNPENVLTFLSYMKREQYGNRPLIYGPLYNAQPIGTQNKSKEYLLEDGKDRYSDNGYKIDYKYRDSDKKLFPRMYEPSRYNSGPYAYTRFVEKTGDPNTPTDDQPTAGEDFRFFIRYQVIHMYWRYFMWNFTGRESDVQDAAWESGLGFSKLSKMPPEMRNDRTKNHYYFLPFLLGLLGFFWQARDRWQDSFIVGLLFFFTGLAIIIYLNQYPAQPRERDYSFAGSFQTYAIWIGLGVIALYELLQKYLKTSTPWVVGIACLLIPGIMAAENWDDHSRAGRYVAPDSAYNLLNSLARNAVLFTNGDNDTFPLWYLQEVEGVRPDVRVLCLSYVNTDWYISQMFEEMNESQPLPLTFTKNDYTGQKNQSKFFQKDKLTASLSADPNQLVANGIISESDKRYVESPMRWTIPLRGSKNSRHLQLVDMLVMNLIENVAKQGWERPVYFANTVAPSSFVGLEPYFRLEGLAYRVLPVRKSATLDPMLSRVSPFRGHIDRDSVLKHLTETFRYRNLTNSKVFYDDNIRRMVGNYYRVFSQLSYDYLAEAEAAESRASMLQDQLDSGGLAGVSADSTRKMIQVNTKMAELGRAKVREAMEFLEANIPFNAATPDPHYLVLIGNIQSRVGMEESAQKYLDYVKDNCISTLNYFAETGDYFGKDQYYLGAIAMLIQHHSDYGDKVEANELNQELMRLSGSFQR